MSNATNPASPYGGSNAANSALPPALPGESFHPTVRVMRLYKPGFHIAATVPALPSSGGGSGSDFALSSHLLLPDSFGDIYLGEKFSAYVAIVNGYPQIPFYNVTLSVRLQTESTVFELQDVRTSPAQSQSQQKVSTFAVLNYNESCDVLITHVLNELGTHTLRVSVQYCLFPSGELKSMRKFYRFNVLLPLIVLSSFREVGHKPMVQCQVTNSTKSPVFIEEMNFIPHNKNCEFTALTSPSSSFSSSDEDPLLLQPEESFAFAFQFTKYGDLVGRNAGYPMIKWCSSMGESSMFRGDDTVIKSSQVPTALLTQPVKFLLMQSPATVSVGLEFEVVLRLINTTSYGLPLRLDCPNFIPDEENKKTAAAVVDEDRGLFFVRVTSTNLGTLDSNDFLDTTLTMYASSPGLFDLPSVFAVHAFTKERHSSGRLCKILVE